MLLYCHIGRRSTCIFSFKYTPCRVFTGLMLLLASVVMLYIKKHITSNGADDEQDVYLIAREMHHRELTLQKKTNVNSLPSIKNRPLLDQIPEQEI